MLVTVGCDKPEPILTKPYSEIPSGPTLRMPGRANWAQAELDSRAQLTDALRDESYRKFAVELPHSPEFLTLYAIFVSDSLHDIPRAEAIYQQALAEPTAGGFTISNYGNFVLEYYKDRKRAESLYQRALQRTPGEGTALALYGLLMCENGNPKEGLRLIKSVKRYSFSHNQRILVRVDLTRFLCSQDRIEQLEALYTLRINMVNRFRATNWDFSRNIDLAKKSNHQDSEWIDRLALVCAEKADIATLKPWTIWREAVRRPLNENVPKLINPENLGDESEER